MTAAPQNATATIQGVVRDESQTAIAGAAVLVTSFETGQVRSARSGADGSFLVVALPPGRYRVVISRGPFAPAVREAELTLNQTLDVSTTLTLAAHVETVEVAATVRPLVDPSQTEIGRTITTRELDGLPISVGQSRDFTGLATLTPGVASDVTVAGGGLTTAGQLSSGNNFVIDGLTSAKGNLPLDAIQEFRVASNQFGAEYGQASGAIVDVLTRSGSNTAGGRLSWFQQDGAWNARSPLAEALDTPDPGFNQTDVSGYWGGPLRPDRAFLFGAVREDVRHTQFIDAATAASAFRPGASVTTPVDLNLPQAFVKSDVRLTTMMPLSNEFEDINFNAPPILLYRIRLDPGLPLGLEPPPTVDLLPPPITWAYAHPVSTQVTYGFEHDGLRLQLVRSSSQTQNSERTELLWNFSPVPPTMLGCYLSADFQLVTGGLKRPDPFAPDGPGDQWAASVIVRDGEVSVTDANTTRIRPGSCRN